MSPAPPASLAGRTVLVANPSADLYGSDRMMLEAVQGMQREASRVIVTCSSRGPLLERLHELGIEARVTTAPVIRKSMLSPRGLVHLISTVASAFPRMRRLIREVDADVVIANTLTLPFWTLAARSCRRPVIVYVHEAESTLSAPSRMLLTTPLRWANGVVFNSETSRAVCSVRSLERRGRVRVVHNGVEGPPSTTPPRHRIVAPLRIVFVGRLSPRKGVDVLVDAAAMLRDQGVETAVDLVGDAFPGYEWYTESLARQITEHGLDDSVRLRGFQDKVWASIEDADVLVVPSRGDESFGNVVIEAILSARPVIVADHSGLREAATGFSSTMRVPADQPERVVQAIQDLLRNWESRREEAMDDAERARVRFSPRRYHGIFIRAIEELAA